MTIRIPHASPGRRFLAYSLASTLLATGIGFVSSATAGSERSLDAPHDRSVLNRRSAADSGRQTPQRRTSEKKAITSSADKSSTHTLTNERETNTDRSELNRRSTNDGRDEVADAIRSLSWSAPMTREDGSKLYPGEIDGYRIYYKKPGEDKFRSININDASLTSYQLGRFKSGVYEFSVTTLDTDGLESRRSRAVSAKLQ